MPKILGCLNIFLSGFLVDGIIEAISSGSAGKAVLYTLSCLATFILGCLIVYEK